MDLVVKSSKGSVLTQHNWRQMVYLRAWSRQGMTKAWLDELESLVWNKFGLQEE